MCVIDVQGDPQCCSLGENVAKKMLPTLALSCEESAAKKSFFAETVFLFKNLFSKEAFLPRQSLVSFGATLLDGGGKRKTRRS